MCDELQESHPGIVTMKSIARSHVWWPGIDENLESYVRHCSMCQATALNSPGAHLHMWSWPSKPPWSQIHIDYAGLFLGRMFLVVIDAHSKWIECLALSSCTSEITVESLRAMFATHGLPDCVVSDNGSCFTSAVF